MPHAEYEREGLHARVRSFIEDSAPGRVPAESFAALACAILGYQAQYVPAYGRLLAAQGIHPGEVTDPRDLPAVPTDAFRLARIAAHSEADDAIVFRTSGTSGGARGEHFMSTTATYELAALAWGSWGLFCDAPKALVAIVLAAPFRGSPEDEPADSSLGFMMQLFATRFAQRSHYLQDKPEQPLRTNELRAWCARARAEGVPVVLMGTSFAFVHVLDALAGARFNLPKGSRAMHTGGFKGRSREVSPELLRREIAETFGLEQARVIGEYGMTELSSQLYEGTWRAHHGLGPPNARHGVFYPPPWMRVCAVDPVTLLPVAPGEIGILRFEDLANVDGALAVQTADRGRLVAGGIELLGRSEGAPPRGCSLALDDLLAPP